jgi:hypothetical protein
MAGQEQWNQEVGTVRIDDGFVHPIAAASLVGGDRGLGRPALPIARPISIREILSASRSTDFSGSVVALDLENDGNPAAR